MADAGGGDVEFNTGDFLKDRMSRAMKRGDIMLALGVVAILVVLILPLPRWLLDFALAFSIMISVLILMTALFVERPLDFNAFPTVLLLATMIRLSLNLASTRLILSDGHEGTQAAGKVIEAFGGFVMGGELRHRNYCVCDLGDRELCRHYQRFRPYCRSVGTVFVGRHARQADGHRRRSIVRSDRRGNRQKTPQRPRRRKRVLRRHGRCRQVRAR